METLWDEQLWSRFPPLPGSCCRGVYLFVSSKKSGSEAEPSGSDPSGSGDPSPSASEVSDQKIEDQEKEVEDLSSPKTQQTSSSSSAINKNYFDVVGGTGTTSLAGSSYPTASQFGESSVDGTTTASGVGTITTRGGAGSKDPRSAGPNRLLVTGFQHSQQQSLLRLQ